MVKILLLLIVLLIGDCVVDWWLVLMMDYWDATGIMRTWCVCVMWKVGWHETSDMRHEMILNIILNGLFCLASQEAIGVQYSTVQYRNVRLDKTRSNAMSCHTSMVRYDKTSWDSSYHEMVVSIWMACSYIGRAKEEKWHDIHDCTVMSYTNAHAHSCM